MSRRFDITNVQLRHYRSIAACDVDLTPLTIVLGPNGSGKSNFLDALRLTSQGLSENLDNALRERGGIKEVRRRSRGHPTSFGIQVSFRTNGTSGIYAFRVGAAKGGDYKVTHEMCNIHATANASEQHYFKVRDGQLIETSEKHIMPPVSSDRLYLVAAAGFHAFRPVFDGLSGINVYSLNPDSMRRVQTPEAGDLLKRDGANIASVLERLRAEREDTKAKIEEYLSQVVEGVTSVNRRSVGAWETIEFRQRVVGDMTPWTFQATSMSDGTLRALGVLVSLFAGNTMLYSPIGIEEPEVALHPAATGLLLEALQAASESRQVLVTTHSPDLLDTPKLDSRDLLAVRASDGTTIINKLDAAGQRALHDELYTPGQLLRLDQLTPEPNDPKKSMLF